MEVRSDDEASVGTESPRVERAEAHVRGCSKQQAGGSAPHSVIVTDGDENRLRALVTQVEPIPYLFAAIRLN